MSHRELADPPPVASPFDSTSRHGSIRSGPRRRRWLAVWALLGICGVPSTVQGLESGQPGFGRQWVRSNPFSIQANSQSATTWDVNEYFGAGMTLLNWDAGNPTTIFNLPPQFAGAKWQAFIGLNNVPSAISTYNALRVNAGSVGWIVGDEPKTPNLPDFATVADYIRQIDASRLVYSNALPGGESGSYYYGSPNPSYNYNQYLDDFISAIHPDVLMYDQYPFRDDGTTSSIYFENLMIVRAKAQANNLPYWGFVQSWGINGNRYPSESDNRFNVYTHLTAGYTGLQYWTYDYYSGTGTGLIDAGGTPTALYYTAAQTNAEAASLGQILRLLDSVEVRFIPGRHDPANQLNSTPAGLTNWTIGAGNDSYVLNLSVDFSDPANKGLGKDGLIGFFTDDAGRSFFVLTNLHHGGGLSSAQTALGFTITFDDSIGTLVHYDRLTGQQELIALDNHQLTWTLPGGSGDLFRYDIDLPGDVNGDGYVDIYDVNLVSANWGGAGPAGDATGDGSVDIFDINVISENWRPAGGSGAAVPEPATCMLFLAGLVRFVFIGSRRHLKLNERRGSAGRYRNSWL